MNVRVGCLIINQDEIALIHRDYANCPQWSLPGGNVEPEEDIYSALLREIDEELGLKVLNLELVLLQDMMIHRPNMAGLYRKLHIIFRISVSDEQRGLLELIEQDNPNSPGVIQWMARDKLAGIHLYPSVGLFLSQLPALSAQLVPQVLPPMTDENYVWR